MSYAPVLVGTGYAGWTFLKRTLASQTTAFNKAPEILRDEDYFRANIGKAKTADDLVNDRRLLKVALGAFGLDGDINSKAFIRKVLSDGTLNEDALANKLADKQYLKLSAAFGYGDFSTPRTALSDFPDKILADYKARQFDAAVGLQSDDMRLGLNAERELAALAAKTGTTEDTKWLTIFGSTPLRRVMEKALGLPASMAALDLDRQLAVFKDKSLQLFGDSGVSQFTDPAKVEALIRRFLVRSEAEASASQFGSQSAALQMLQNSVAFGRQRF
jgi:hypothetical protein